MASINIELKDTNIACKRRTLNCVCGMLNYRSWILNCKTIINSKHQCCKPKLEFWRGYNAIVQVVCSLRCLYKVIKVCLWSWYSAPESQFRLYWYKPTNFSFFFFDRARYFCKTNSVTRLKAWKIRKLFRFVFSCLRGLATNRLLEVQRRATKEWPYSSQKQTVAFRIH